MLRALFRRPSPPPPPPPSVGADRRVYAIGDVHGRLDLLKEMLALIRADLAARPAATAEVLLLGDLIDRGSESAGVVRLAMHPPGWATFRVLKGNHEASLLDTLDGDADVARSWLRYGGDASLRSWGVAEPVIAEAPLEELIEAARSAISPEERRWLADLPEAVTIGDYHFVHAGVRPGLELAAQTAEDLLWIRGVFLDSDLHHGAMIVHGHSISREVEEKPNRIGIDTGAYCTGRLSAVALQGIERWFLQTGGNEAGPEALPAD